MAVFPAVPIAGPIEQVLHDMERLLDVHITLQDYAVFFSKNTQCLFGPNRNSHRRYKLCAAVFNRRCIDHCYRDVFHLAGAENEAFVNRCPWGVIEIEAPIRFKGVLVGVLSAGQWRDKRIRQGKQLSRRVQTYLRELPEAEGDKMESLRRVLNVFADGLAVQVAALSEKDGEQLNRRDEIYRYIRLQGVQHASLAELASKLHLSPSRTRHLVKTLMGRSFQELIQQERIRKAKVLLVSSSFPIAQIGQMVGINEPCYFSRLFTQVVGVSPSQFRQNNISSE